MLSDGFSWYVIALTALNIFGCVALLLWTAKRRPGDPAPTETSHVWDGDLTEYNKPLPRWWINLFYLTIIFAIAYLMWYPGLGNWAGYANWTSRGQYAAEMGEENARREQLFAGYVGVGIEQLARDPQAVDYGRAIFGNNCAACHGSTAQGAVGFPNLADSSWQWGDTPELILESIVKGRVAAMPQWATALRGLGGEQAIDDVVQYVRSLSGVSVADDRATRRGAGYFASLCVACHGAEGKGNVALGAPDLTDDVWLYGSSPEAIRTGLLEGRQGQMPAQADLLGDTRSRLVGAYVWSLSHGSPADPGAP